MILVLSMFSLTVYADDNVVDLSGDSAPLSFDSDTTINVTGTATINGNGTNPAISITKGTLTVNLTADSILNLGIVNGNQRANSRAALRVAPGATLIVKGEGTLNATGGYASAGIGGNRYEHSGTINIHSGNINADTVTTWDYNGGGAAIGGGSSGTAGKSVVNIFGGNIMATGRGDAGFAAIGKGAGGDAIVSIYDGVIVATNAGQGAGISGGVNGETIIHGGKITATGCSHSSGLGGIVNNASSTVTINGGDVTATGIGGSNSSDGGTIIINGGTVTTSFIGTPNLSGESGGSVTINGGTIKTDYIGGGTGDRGERIGDAGGDGGKITINGGNITTKRIGGATGGDTRWWSNVTGGAGGAGGEITINGGLIVAERIGGADGRNTQDQTGGAGGACGTISINGGVIVANQISGGDGGTGYTKGSGGSGGTINISGGTIRTANNTSTKIGAGAKQTPGTPGVYTITGGSVNAIFDDTPIDENRNPVYKSTITVGNPPIADEFLTLGKIDGPTYDVSDVKTDSAGKVYFWLPTGNAKISSLVDGYDYGGNQTIAADNSNAFTLSKGSVGLHEIDVAATKEGNGIRIQFNPIISGVADENISITLDGSMVDIGKINGGSGSYLIPVLSEVDGELSIEITVEGCDIDPATLLFDNISPTATVSEPDSQVKQLLTGEIEITFDEDVDDTDATVVLSNGGTLSNESLDGNVYTATYLVSNYSASYDVSIAGFKDFSGNIIRPGIIGSFTTKGLHNIYFGDTSSYDIFVGQVVAGRQAVCATTPDVSYSSDDLSVVDIDGITGQLTAKKAGSATITATASASADYYSNSATYTVNVAKNHLDTPSSINASLRVGDTVAKSVDIMSIPADIDVANITTSNFSGDIGSILFPEDINQDLGWQNTPENSVGIDSESNLTLKYSTSESGQVGDSVGFKINIVSEKYQDVTIEVAISLIDTDAPTVIINNISKTYDGQSIPDSAIVGVATFNEQSVAGSWSFVGTNPKVVSDSGNHQVTFTPMDSINYKSVVGNVNVTISKVSSTGAPQFEKITSLGLTLADVKLSLGTLSPEGTVTWVQDDTQQIVENTAYEWIFTPYDSDNFQSLSGNVVLYDYKEIDSPKNPDPIEPSLPSEENHSSQSPSIQASSSNPSNSSNTNSNNTNSGSSVSGDIKPIKPLQLNRDDVEKLPENKTAEAKPKPENSINSVNNEIVQNADTGSGVPIKLILFGGGAILVIAGGIFLLKRFRII